MLKIGEKVKVRLDKTAVETEVEISTYKDELRVERILVPQDSLYSGKIGVITDIILNHGKEYYKVVFEGPVIESLLLPEFNLDVVSKHETMNQDTVKVGGKYRYELRQRQTNELLVDCIVEVTKILNDEVCSFKVLKVFVDDSGNSFYTYLHEIKAETNGSCKYLSSADCEGGK